MVEGIRKSIAVVSFNANEARAVDLLLSDLALGAPSQWARDGERGIRRPYGADEWRLEHVPLSAQGNVLAGVQLAEIYRDQHPPDYVVFYGCAGALQPDNAESVFVVRHANYLSLGTVTRAADNHETVTLKNKWLCHISPPDEAEPLEVVSFPTALTNSGALDVCQLSGIPAARVAATDKVVRIRAGVAPTPVQAGPPHDIYTKAEWSYGEALALVAAEAAEPVIVEMESYGIGRIAAALKFEDRVVVLRVTTDSLEDHEGSDLKQQELLERGRATLGRVLLVLFAPTTLVE
jgi:nucleoside phosphorylase